MPNEFSHRIFFGGVGWRVDGNVLPKTLLKKLLILIFVIFLNFSILLLLSNTAIHLVLWMFFSLLPTFVSYLYSFPLVYYHVFLSLRQ